MLRAAADSDPNLSVDCIGAYSHVLRASLLGRLATMSGGPGIHVTHQRKAESITRSVGREEMKCFF